MRQETSLAWPDRYFFYRAFIACSISAHRKKRVWSRSSTQVAFDTSEPTRGVEFFDLKVICSNFCALGNVVIHLAIQREWRKRTKEINTSGRLGVVKNDLCNGMRPDPLFATGTYIASDKCPVEKVAVWPRETSWKHFL